MHGQKNIKPMFIQYLIEMIPPFSQNNVGVSNQISVLILYYITSSLVNLLKVIDAPIQVSDILFLLPVTRSLILAFRYSFFLFLISLLASRLTSYRFSTLLWFGSF